MIEPDPRSGAENGTLGFGAIYVLTEDVTTWRVQGLLQAAQKTDLQLEIHTQQRLSDEELLREVGADTAETSDALRLLLNHMSLIEEFLRSDLETVLILEDDVDFSVNIKSQMASLSQAILGRLRPEGSLEKNTSHPYQEDAWDMLWLGHYGMQFVSGTSVTSYDDPYALPWKHLTSPFNNYYERMASSSTLEHIQSQQLIFHVAPLCTFAYALTRSYAERIVERLRQDRAQPIDVLLHNLCKDPAQRCVAPVPEVFHHHKVAGAKTIGNPGSQDHGVEDMAWYRSTHKYTYNIEWSARCGAAKVGEQLGDRWQCLPRKHDDLV